jgi:hypothetical protein
VKFLFKPFAAEKIQELWAGALTLRCAHLDQRRAAQPGGSEQKTCAENTPAIHNMLVCYPLPLLPVADVGIGAVEELCPSR